MPDGRGCAFINVGGELTTSATARAIARDHKLGLRVLLTDVAQGCGVADPVVFTERLMLLVEGAIVTAHIEGAVGTRLAGTRGPVSELVSEQHR